MKIKWLLPTTAIAVVFILVWWMTDQVQGQENIINNITAVTTNAGSEITYQGTLQDNGSPANGDYNMRFRLYDARDRGNQVGSDVTLTDVRVTQGQFTVDIDFGYAVYNGQALYLEIAIRSGNGGFETLSPRQPLTGVPLAHSVRPGMVVDNTSYDTSAQLAGPTVGVAGSGNFGGYFSGNTGALVEGVFNDLVLSGDGFFSGIGSISSDPDIANSSLYFNSNDGLFIALDSNNDGDDGLLTVQYHGRDTMTLAGGGQQTLYNHSETPTIVIDGDQDGGGTGADIVLRNGDNEIIGRFHNDANEGGGQLDLRDQDGNSQLVLEAEETSGDGANIIMRNYLGDDTIVLDAQKESDFGAQVLLLDSTGDPAARLHNDTNEGGELQLYDSMGSLRVIIEAEETNSDGAQMVLYDSDGNATIVIDADYEGTGNGRITTEVLEITGGADLSEQFEIEAALNGATVAPEPGFVVCIDPRNPGQLVVCSAAYDSTVAGIISGAGDVQVGLLMGQDGSIADGRYPVALTGRVYVWAQAGEQAIQPGDLLTTSAQAGYAMPAIDANKAFGAILGKAMTGLDAGESGLVLVLVSLQ